MTSDGWNADRTQVLVHQILYWLADQRRLADQRHDSKVPEVGELAAALGFSEALVENAAHILQQQDAVTVVRAFARPSGLMITPSGVATAATWRSQAQEHRARRQACREALLDWAYVNEGIVPPRPLASFHQDPRAFFYGEPFAAAEDVTGAVRHLDEGGLVKVERVDQSEFLTPTHNGRVCVEEYHGDIAQYQRSRSAAPTDPGASSWVISGTNVNVNNNSPGTRLENSTVSAPAPVEPTTEGPREARRTQILVALIGGGTAILAAVIGLTGVLISR